MFNPFGGTNFNEMKEFLEFVEAKQKETKDKAGKKEPFKIGFIGNLVLLGLLFPFVFVFNIGMIKLMDTWFHILPVLGK